MGLFDNLFSGGTGDWLGMGGGGSSGSAFDGLFGGGTGGWLSGGADWFGSGGTDSWWQDVGGWAFGGDGGDSGLGGFDWGDLLGTSGGNSGGGWANTIGNIAGGLFGGGGQQGAGGGNIWGSLLSGLGGAASGYLSGKDLKESVALKAKEDRRTIGFEYDLKDYYEQLGKQRKRVALDTYGQFSLLGNSVTPTPAVQVPTKPNGG